MKCSKHFLDGTSVNRRVDVPEKSYCCLRYISDPVYVPDRPDVIGSRRSPGESRWFVEAGLRREVCPSFALSYQNKHMYTREKL